MRSQQIFNMLLLYEAPGHTLAGRLNTLDQWWLPEGVSCHREPGQCSPPPSSSAPGCCHLASVLLLQTLWSSSAGAERLTGGKWSLSFFFFFFITPAAQLGYLKLLAIKATSPGSLHSLYISDTCRNLWGFSCNHGGRGFLSPGWEQAGDDYR